MTPLPSPQITRFDSTTHGLLVGDNHVRKLRFLAHVPETLRLDVLRLCRVWHAKAEGSGAVVDALQTRLAHDLRSGEIASDRIQDCRLLLNALRAHRSAAVELVGAVCEGQP